MLFRSAGKGTHFDLYGTGKLDNRDNALFNYTTTKTYFDNWTVPTTDATHSFKLEVINNQLSFFQNDNLISTGTFELHGESLMLSYFNNPYGHSGNFEFVTNPSNPGTTPGLPIIPNPNPTPNPGVPSIPSVPEPSTALFAVIAFGFCLLRRKR